MINFGTTVIGEVINRKITLSNKGALGTKFEIFNLKKLTLKQNTESSRLSELENIMQASDNANSNLISTGQSEREKSNISIIETIDAKEETKEDEITIGSIREGYIKPFSEIELDFNFAPAFPGKFHEDFAIKFEDKDSRDVISEICSS